MKENTEVTKEEKNILGIVAEYNPFHNGHSYHLETAKQMANADCTIAIMSGNFTQRGSTSVVNKWTKAQMAIQNGIDLVIELPTIYSVSSAENFAQGAIKILNELNIVNKISFGVETQDIAALNNIATILSQETKEYKNLLSAELKKGISYPKARENALILYFNDDIRYKNILNNPNNILGVEYLKALKTTKSAIEPIPIKREKVYYNDDKIVDDFASATAIRNMLQLKAFEDIIKVVPRATYNILRQETQVGNVIIDLSAYEKEIIYNLRRMSVKQIAEIPDVTEGLENNIKYAVNFCNTLEGVINIIKSKRYTQTRLQRIFLFSLLGITKKDMYFAKKTTPYVRVLGFSEKGKELISKIKKSNPKIQLIMSVKKFEDTNTNKTYKRMMEIDRFATDVYTLAYKDGALANLDYTKGIQ